MIDPSAWLHILDNTEGIEGNEPEQHLSFSPESPFGVPGVDHSESFSVRSIPLEKELMERVAKFLGYGGTSGLSFYELSLCKQIVDDGLAAFDSTVAQAKHPEPITISEIEPDVRDH